MEIKDFIKVRRKQLKMSLQTLGDAINYTPQAIARFENGKVKVDIRLIDDLIKTLNVSLSTFLNCDIDNIVEYDNTLKFDEDKFFQTFKFYKERTKISQTDLANTLNINKNRVSKIERGISFPTIDEFKELCKVFDVSYETLYYGLKIEEPLENENIKENKKKTKINKVFLSLFIIVSIMFTSLLGGVIANYALRNGTNNSSGNTSSPEEGPINNYFTVTYHYDLSDETITEYVYQGRFAPNLEYIHEGYTLIGYYIGEDEFDFSTPINSDITLTGKLKKKEFDIYFYDYYGSLASYQVVPYLESATPPILEPISNLTFKGWNTDEYLSVRKSLSIYPLYDSYTTRVYFDLDGGSFLDPFYPKYIDNFKYEDIYTLPSIFKKGHTFNYFTFNNIEFNESTILEPVMTLKAKYNLNEYTITFKNNILDPIKVNFLDEVSLPLKSKDNLRNIRKYYADDNKVLDSTFIYDYDRDIEIRVLFEGNDYSYIVNEDNTITLTSIENENKDTSILIPSVIDGYKVSKIAPNFISNDNDIESLTFESNSLNIETNAFYNLPSLKFVDFSSINEGIFDDNIFALCPNIEYLKIARVKRKINNGDYLLKNYGLIQNNNLSVEMGSNCHEFMIPEYFNKGFGKIKKLIISAEVSLLTYNTFDWLSMELNEFYCDVAISEIYLYLTSSFTQKELTIYSTNVEIDGNYETLDKITFVNDIFSTKGIGSIKAKTVEFCKTNNDQYNLQLGVNTLIYCSNLILRKYIDFPSEEYVLTYFYHLEETMNVYTYKTTLDYEERLKQYFNSCDNINFYYLED